MMQPLVYWREPKAVADWRWQHNCLPACRKLSTLSIFATILFGVLATLLTKIFLPSALPATSAVSLGAIFFFPALFFFACWVDDKIWREAPCYLYDIGFRHRGFYAWQNVSSYSIRQHPHLPEIKYLCFKMTEGERRLHFTLHHVEEEKLRAAFDGRLPESTSL